jgi:hypothetical protein
MSTREWVEMSGACAPVICADLELWMNLHISRCRKMTKIEITDKKCCTNDAIAKWII